MSPVHRALVPGPVQVDMRLIEEIEGLVMIDCQPPPDVVAPLAAAAQAGADVSLPDTWGGFLDLDEVHAVQRLRGCHRTRYGQVTVDAWWLADVRNILDSLTLGLESECDQELSDAEYDAGLHAQVKARIEETGYCGDCMWCRALKYRDECDTILDAAGYDGGSRYRAYRPAPDDSRPVEVVELPTLGEDT